MLKNGTSNDTALKYTTIDIIILETTWLGKLNIIIQKIQFFYLWNDKGFRAGKFSFRYCFKNLKDE